MIFYLFTRVFKLIVYKKNNEKFHYWKHNLDFKKKNHSEKINQGHLNMESQHP